ncbi:VOC family protein [uncultured Campylobacter sp.]|nr:VOC family protein [uncultured Campylobacter sp.]
MNKITCVCLGVQSMQRVLKFYRDGLGYETDYKDDDQQRAFNSSG